MAEIGAAFVTIAPSAKGFGKDLDRQVGSETKKSGSTIGQKFTAGMGKVMRVGAKATGVAVAGTLGTALVKGFGRLKAIDQAEAKLRGLGYTAKEITGIMNSATEAVTGTAFGLDEAATVSASALASGVKEGKELTDYLTLVGDAATQGGTSFAEMGAIMNKTTARGKVGMENLNQLSERGIGVMGWLAEEYGVTGEELSKMVSKGEVDTETLQRVLKKNIGGAAQEAGNTFSGAFANMNAALGRLGAKILGPIFKRMPAIFGGIGTALDKVGPYAERLGDALAKGMAKAVKAAKSLLRAIQPVVKEIGKKLAPVVERINKFFKDHPEVIKGAAIALGILAGALTVAAIAMGALSIAMSPITLILLAVAALGAGIAYLWKNSETFRTVVTKVGDALEKFGSYVVSTIVPAVLSLAKAVGTKLQPVWKALGSFFSGTIVPLIQKVTAKLEEWWPTIQKVIQIVAKMIAWWVKLQAAIAGKVIPVVLKIAGFLLRTLVPALLKPIDIAVRLAGALVNMGGAIGRAGGAVGRGAKNIYNGIKRWIGNAVDWLRDIPGKIGGIFAGIWDGLAGGLKTAINAVLHLPIKLPKVNTHIPGVGTVGGQTLIPALAKGTKFHQGGMALVGEEGPELVNLPRGSRVHTAAQTRAIASALPDGAATGGQGVDYERFAAAVASALHRMGLTLQIGRDAAGSVVIVGNEVIAARS